ncbi:MAG: alpha/beta hydrolase [Nocardioidaceae bacterium]
MTEPTQTNPGPSPDRVLRYAGHDDGIVDLHLPASLSVGQSADRPAPLLVLIHGGFWRAEWDRTHTRPMAAALRDLGYLVVTPEYRRTGAGGGWPATFDDVGRATAAIPVLLGEADIEVTTTTVVGHSAGGHLALWLANEGLPLDRVVALAPVGDLQDAYARDLDGGAVRDLFGGAPRDDADPAQRLREDPGCPVIVLHGTADLQVPVENSRGWASTNPFVELRILDGAEHFGLIDPTSTVWPEVVAAVGN